MSRLRRSVLYAAAAAAWVLHNDLWLWDSPRRVLGLPVGLLYHVVFCLAVAGLMALLVTLAWPDHLESSDGDSAGKEGAA